MDGNQFQHLLNFLQVSSLMSVLQEKTGPLLRDGVGGNLVHNLYAYYISHVIDYAHAQLEPLRVMISKVYIYFFTLMMTMFMSFFFDLSRRGKKHFEDAQQGSSG